MQVHIPRHAGRCLTMAIETLDANAARPVSVYAAMRTDAPRQEQARAKPGQAGSPAKRTKGPHPSKPSTPLSWTTVQEPVAGLPTQNWPLPAPGMDFSVTPARAWAPQAKSAGGLIPLRTSAKAHMEGGAKEGQRGVRHGGRPPQPSHRLATLPRRQGTRGLGLL
jgi:hypothetical protein